MGETAGADSFDSLGWFESLDARRREISAKVASARELMERTGIEALHLTSVASCAWLTAGAATYVDESVDAAAISALLTRSVAYILTDPIEAPRLEGEEHLSSLGFTLVSEPWYARGPALQRLTAGLRVASEERPEADDTVFWRDWVWRRATLGAREQGRLRAGAQLAGAVMDEVARAVRPGMAEWEVAARLGAASRTRGGAAIVTLVGADDRIACYRHPLATARPIERYTLLVLCFRYRGLVTALTRSVSFGELPTDLLETAKAVARVDARMLAGTRPGHTLADMFALARQAYADEGRPEAIEEHHQGGPIAYRSREALAAPGNKWPIAVGQAFAWNPSLRGAKSEDTALLTESGVEIVSRITGWPVWSIETPEGVYERPAILQAPT